LESFLLPDLFHDVGAKVHVGQLEPFLIDYPDLAYKSISADWDLLFWEFTNLANNTPAAAATFCEADASGRGRSKLCLGDDGPGIPERPRNQMFQPCHASTTKEGASLSLAIAYDITQAQGGSLTLDLPNSNGTEFHLDLPIVP